MSEEEQGPTDAPVDDAPDRSKNDARHAGSFTLITILSRGLGFVRSLLMAALLGGTMGADAFWASFKLVNFFRLFMGEGAMGNAVLPVLKELEVDRPDEWKEFAARCARTAVMLCSLFLIGGSFVLPQIVAIYQPGMGPEARSLTIHLTEIMAPYLVLIGLVSILMTPLQSMRVYGPVAGHPVLFNLALIGAALGAAHFPSAAEALAWGVVIGGLMQASMLVRSARSHGIPVLRPGPLGLTDPAMKKVGRLMLPSLVGVALMRVTTLVDGAFASTVGTGALSHLQYGSLLFNAALGIAATGVAVVYFTPLSEAAASEDPEAFTRALSRGGGLIFVLTVPVTVLAVCFPETIARIYFWGRFELADLGPTSAAVRWYFAGLALGGMSQLLGKGLFARGEQTRVVKAGVLAAALNIYLDWALVEPYGVAGLAGATSAALGLNALCLAWMLREALRGAGLGAALARTLGPALAAAAVCHFLPGWALSSPFVLPPFLGGLYLAILHAGNTAEYQLLRQMLRRRRG